MVLRRESFRQEVGGDFLKGVLAQVPLQGPPSQRTVSASHDSSSEEKHKSLRGNDVRDDDNGRVENEPRNDPDEDEEDKGRQRHPLLVQVLPHFPRLY